MKFIFIILFSFLLSKDAIAILDFESIGVSEQEAYIVTQSLLTELIKADKYRIIERGSVDRILKEQKFQQSGCTDSGCAVEVGQLINADFVVIGNTSKLGSTYSINARIIDVESGEATISAQFYEKGTIDILIEGTQSIAAQLSNQSRKNSNKKQQPSNNNSKPIADPNKIYNIPIGGSFVKGNKDAPITMIKFTDFQ